MNKAMALTAAVVLSQAIVLFAGETEVSSKDVIQTAAPPPASYFRANELDLGLFGTYDTSFNGAGFEYRFTPHIGIFSDAGYEIVDGPKNNFMQANFGLKYAF